MSARETGSFVDKDRTLAQKYADYRVDEADPVVSRGHWEQIMRAGVQEVLDAKLSEFKSKLSRAQFMSHLLLEQWFRNRRLDPVFDSAAENAFQDVPARNDGAEIPNRYHCHMTRLWRQERLIRLEVATNVSLDNILDTVRRNAFIYTSCQRVASSYYNFLQSEHQKIPYVPDMRFQDIATLDVCSWLPRPEPGLDSMPYYLWDVKAKQTIEVSTIFERTGTLPGYTAISHTWGRYRKKNEPSISIPGVRNWRVPQNYKFDVLQLPQIMQQLPYDYVWLDLLTIPQLEEGHFSSDMANLQREEIARQATIFQSATNAIVWFNDVNSWDSVKLGLGWAYLTFLEMSGLEDSNKAAVPFNELIDSPMYDNKGPSVEVAEMRDGQVLPNGWFTSLWTLQEICLRPDMLLLNQSFEFLSLTPDQRPLSFSDIISILYLIPDVPRSPGATKVLMHILGNEAGFKNLLTPSRTQILAMGNCRQCSNERRRGEAIMSAIGATKWFKNPIDGQGELVMGNYPLGFINEIREMVGSGKFFYFPCSQGPLISLLRTFCGSELETSTRLSWFRRKTKEPPTPPTHVGIGSLLPLNRAAVCLNLELEHLIRDVSPLTGNWQIEPSGKVRIYDAAIVSSSLSKTVEEKEDCWILGVREWKSNGRDVKLNKWLRDFKPEMPNYAVCLLYHETGARIYGVLLKEVTTGVMIKIGIFIQERDWPSSPVPTTKVDWVVL